MASLHDRLISHAHFFDSTLNLIPTDVYFPKELSEEQILNAKFMKNKRGRAPKQQLKDDSKKNIKRTKLDPEAQQSTTEILKSKVLEEKAENAKNKKKNLPTTSQGTVDSIDALRDRLKAKLLDLQSKRQSTKDKSEVKHTKKSEKRSITKHDNPRASIPQQNRKEEEISSIANRAVNDVAKGATEKSRSSGMLFGQVHLIPEENTKSWLKKRRKVDKHELLKKAEQKQKRLQQLKKSEEGKFIAAQVQMEDALKRVLGEKVKDNPKLLKKSIQKDEQKKRKSAAKWKERQDQTKQAQIEAQQKRKENLSTKRSRGRKDDQGKRAGFEGKRKEFLNKDTRED